MIKITKPKLNMKITKFINKVKQKIKQTKVKKKHDVLKIKETEFEDEFGDLESISLKYPIFIIGNDSDNEELGCNVQ